MSANPKGRLEASLCENCFEVFFSKKLFDIHVKKCSEPRSHVGATASLASGSTISKCPTCRRIFLGDQRLAQHVKKEHGTTKVVKTVVSCQDCQKLFMDADGLAKHMKQVHSPAAPSTAQPEGREPQSKVVTISQPKVVSSSQSKVVAISQPKVVSSSPAKVVTISQPRVVSIPPPKVVLKTESKPEATSKAESASKPVSESKPQCDPEQESGPEPETKSSKRVSEPQTELKSAPGVKSQLASMPILGADSDGAQLLDELIGDQELDTEQTEPQEANSPPAPETGRSPLTEPDAAEPSTEVEVPAGQTPTRPATTSVSMPAVVSNAPPATPVAAIATTSATAVNSAAATVSANANLFFACGSCNFMFVDKDLLLKHLAEKHGHGVIVTGAMQPRSDTPAKKPASRGPTLYACAICDAKYKTVDLVKAHIEKVHGAPRDTAFSVKPGARRDSVWSTQECQLCSTLFRPSVRLRDIYISLSEWTTHFYGEHSATEKLTSGKRLELRPCHRCGLVFVNNATRLHHNAIAHDGRDPEAEMKRRQQEEDREVAAPAVPTAQITPKSLSVKARSRVIVDSLMKASLVSRSSPTITLDKAAAKRAQKKVFAARTTPGRRLTNVVFKCSKCGGMFPDDPSFERHAREAHPIQGQRGGRAASPPPAGPSEPPPAVEAEPWDLLGQRECSDCSKLMETCPRSFALFVRRDVWERHVTEVHQTMRWRCTGERFQLNPCPHCPRLFLHPNTLQAHQTKLHDAMLGPVDQDDVDACTLTNTLECSRCAQIVQNADGIRFLEGAAWKKHFETEHKELLLCDGKAGQWQLFPCVKCERHFFKVSDLPTHEARQAYMHMPMPANAKVTTQKRGQRTSQETEILYQCANEDCPFFSHEHDAMVAHFQQCREARPTRIGQTVLYKTVMVRKPPPKPRRFKSPRPNNREPRFNMRRMDNVIQKLATSGDGGAADSSEPSEAAAAVSQLLQAEPDVPAVLELDPVTLQPRSVHALQPVEDLPEANSLDLPEAAAMDVPEAAAEEETVAAEEATDVDAVAAPTRMDFACSVCNMRGNTRGEIAAHIRRDHKRSDGTFGLTPEQEEERRQQVRNYKSAYLCNECKRMALPCPRTRDLYFEKVAWLNHLTTTHKPTSFSELDRLDLHECGECEKLFLGHASLKRHARFNHDAGAEDHYRSMLQKQSEERNEKHKFSCVEEGCTFKYHRITRLRTHLINVHNFDLAVREVKFNSENDFQEWKKSLELTTNAYFVVRSNVQAKRKKGTFNVRYFGCSRVMANLPSYKENGKKRTLPWQVDLLKEDMVWRCPAFMKAEVADNSTSINVTFCPNHYGHDMDPSFGRLSDSDEAEIGGMLRAGLSIQDVLKRMREEGRRQGTPNRKQRVTEAEINRIFEKYMGIKPPKAKRFDPQVGKAVSRSSLGASAPVVNWNADLVSYEDAAMDNTAGDEMSLDDAETAGEGGGVGARDAWQRVCGEDQCRFTTTSVGFLRSHLRQRHGFAMHIDTAGFASMKDFTRWKRSLEKRTCAKYTCYKSVARTPSDPTDPVVTRYYTCHRSGLNSLKKAPSHAPLPRRLVLCTGYMKVRCDNSTGEVACEYCASHYGHDARLADRRAAEREPDLDMIPVEYETVEDDGVASPPGVDRYGSPERNGFSSPAATRYSFVREEAPVSDQEAEPPRRPRGRPAKKRPTPARRSRGGKRRRWEEVEEEEVLEEEEEEQQDSYESD